jgi:hypothetical protein
VLPGYGHLAVIDLDYFTITHEVSTNGLARKIVHFRHKMILYGDDKGTVNLYDYNANVILQTCKLECACTMMEIAPTFQPSMYLIGTKKKLYMLTLSDE